MVFYNQMHVKTRLSQPIFSKIVGPSPISRCWFPSLVTQFLRLLVSLCMPILTRYYLVVLACVSRSVAFLLSLLLDSN